MQQDIIALCPFHTSYGIGCRIALWVSYVQALTRWMEETIYLAAELGTLLSFKSLIFGANSLPFFFDCFVIIGHHTLLAFDKALTNRVKHSSHRAKSFLASHLI